MKWIARWAGMTLSAALLAAMPKTDAAPAQAEIGSRMAKIGDAQLHYLISGKGPAVLLLHGYAETSRMWRPLIPLLAQRFTVIAPDLPGIGESSIPEGEIGMIQAADEIHELVKSLGVKKAEVVGHDIGLMVAYAYAARFPDETEKLALMDAFLPGVPGWESIYDSPDVWHFRFHGEYPEKLVQGRERTYFEYFWNVLAADGTHSIPEADRKAYTAAYSGPGRMRAGWAYFASWPKLATDFARLAKTKLKVPLLTIGGEKSLGKELGEQGRLVADNPTVIVLPNTGHWILEERQKETMDALLKFL